MIPTVNQDLRRLTNSNLKIDVTIPTDLRDWSRSVEKNPSTYKPVNAEESHSGEKDSNDIKVTKYTNIIPSCLFCRRY